jgi:hypothetical protein
MYKKQLMFFASLLMLFSAFFFGCDQEKFDAGIELVPDSLRINTGADDNYTVEAYTYKVEKLRTNNASKVLLGSYTDPILGKINASFVTELIPSSTNVDPLKTDSTELDDLMLYLRYPLSGLRVYGDSTMPIRIKVMEIKKYLSYSDTIYSNFMESELMAVLIDTITFNPKQIITDADDAAEDKYWELIEEELADTANGKQPDTASIERPDPVHLLAIKLPENLRDRITDLVTSSINDFTTFAQQFNGLYLTIDDSDPNPNPNSISIFDYTDAETKVSLHYHYDSDTTDMGRSYDFSLGGATTRFNLFNSNYLPGIENLTNEQDTVIYLHGTAGLRAKIMFPDLDEKIKEGLYAVNRAELIFQVENGTEEGIYPVPNNLILKRIADEDEEFDEYPLEEYSILDQYGNISSYSGATYNNGEYKFDITSYMQKVFKEDYDNNGLFLSIPDESINPSRVVLTSGEHSNRIKLKLTLTKLFN